MTCDLLAGVKQSGKMWTGIRMSGAAVNVLFQGGSVFEFMMPSQLVRSVEEGKLSREQEN